MQNCCSASQHHGMLRACLKQRYVAKQTRNGTCLQHGGGGTGHGAGIMAADCAAVGAPPATCSGHQTHTRSVPNMPPRYTRLQGKEREHSRQEAEPLCMRCAAVLEGHSPGLAAWE